MPLEIVDEESKNDEFNVFMNLTPSTVEEVSKHRRPILDYSNFKEGRNNDDLRSQTGENVVKEKEKEMGIDSNNAPNAHNESWGEMIRNSLPNNPMDANNDGVVDSKDIALIKESSISKVKAVGSSIGKTISSGLTKTLETAGSVALNVGDVNEDGVIDNKDLGEAVRATRENLGINDVARGMKSSVDTASTNMIYVGGAVILIYLLVKN